MRVSISFNFFFMNLVDRDHLRSRGLAVQRNLFDQSTGLMRPKNRNGQFDHNFLPHRWGGAYTEGSAWHHSFPPYAIQELAKIHGGKVRSSAPRRS
jgi:putative alpha-1,2-mannosidase